MNSNLPIDDLALTRILACAALSPAPCGVLVLGNSRGDIEHIASAFQQMLQVTTGQEIGRPVQLGVNESEDDLWGILSLERSDHDELKLWHRAGVLTQVLDQPGPGLVVIPDLSQISLATKRAIVSTIGAPEVYFERHGLHKTKNVNIYWLAACSESAIGFVSRHLLDRFGYRAVKAPELFPDKVAALSARFSISPLVEASPVNLLPSESSLQSFLPILRSAKDQLPLWTEDAISRVLDLFPNPLDCHFRRQLSLARVAYATSQLDRRTEVTAKEVDEAAELIGVLQSTPQLGDVSATATDEQHLDRDEPEAIAPNEIVDREIRTESTSVTTLPLDNPWANVVLSPLPSHYPEDTVLPSREFNDLRYPMTRRSKKGHAQGLVIGIERTRVLVDLAIKATIFEAAKYGQIRRRNNPQLGDLLKITLADLRRHKRSPNPDHMLILLLDHTCVAVGNHAATDIIEAVEDALVDHLRWAHSERAIVTIIEVGRSDAEDELAAKKIDATSIVDPRISLALDLKPGRATPLAHGLSLIHETLRRNLWQGRNQPQRVRVAILTDGRGNVPLSASLLCEIEPPTYGAGLDDCFEQARKIRNFTQSESLGRVEIDFLTPQTRIAYGRTEQPHFGTTDVRVKLAREMNARLSLITA